MPGLFGSCFRCERRKDRSNGETKVRRKDRKLEVVVKRAERDRERTLNEAIHDDVEEEEQDSDMVRTPKWEEARLGDDQITKPKPIRVHLRRPSSMGFGYKVGLVYDERMCAHYDMDDSTHPEKPQRISSIYDTLEAAGIVRNCERVAAREATTAELSCVHDKKHIDDMRSVSNHAHDKSSRGALSRKYNSVYFNEGSSRSALLAAGSCVELALKVAKGELGAGAAVVRPPGHHAEADRAMGFCLFNNVAIAAHYLVHCQPALGIKKVLIVDWDVHHGNGTQHMFWKDPFVLFFSIHRYENGLFYPTGADGNSDQIGEGAGKGFNINVPWQRRGYGDLDYLAVFDHLLMPIAQEFNPDMVFISAGFDSALGDPLGGCKITPAGYFQMTQRLMALAGGRVVLALEGGYNLKSISASYLACMKALLGESFEETVSRELRASTWDLIKEVRQKVIPFWNSLPKTLPEHPPEHFDVAEDVGLDSAYQDSASASEEESDELDTSAEDMAEKYAAGLDVEDHPGDLLTQLRTLDKTEEARLSSVQRSEVEGMIDGISNLRVQGVGKGTGIQGQAPVTPTVNWEELLDETSKNFKDL